MVASRDSDPAGPGERSATDDARGSGPVDREPDGIPGRRDGSSPLVTDGGRDGPPPGRRGSRPTARARRWLGSVGETRRRIDAEYSIDEYWDWLAVTLFLLITVDMLTTLFASVNYGVVAEINPLIRWALARGLVVLAAVNLVAVVLAVGLFAVLMHQIRRTPSPYDRYFAVGVEVWLALLMSAGLLVFANNLAVIVLGGSLL